MAKANKTVSFLGTGLSPGLPAQYRGALGGSQHVMGATLEVHQDDCVVKIIKILI